jgi:hypothetical protein
MKLIPRVTKTTKKGLIATIIADRRWASKRAGEEGSARTSSKHRTSLFAWKCLTTCNHPH